MQTNQQISYETEKVLIAGLDNAGKSSIQDILRYLPTEAALRRTPSQDMEIFQKKFMKKKYIFFIPPGQEDLRKLEFHGEMKEEYFTDVSTFIFVIDAADTSRFNEVINELQFSIEDLIDLSPKCKQFLIFAHKQDLAAACSNFEIEKQILQPLKKLYPGIITKFKLFETTILNHSTIHEPFLKAIAKHVGLERVNFDELADWVRKQVSAKVVLITDSNGLLIGESFVGEENSQVFAAYVAKIFSATEDFKEDLLREGIKIVVLEEEEEKNYTLISRINCTKDDYLALFIGNPSVHQGMARLVNKKGLKKLKIAYQNYK